MNWRTSDQNICSRVTFKRDSETSGRRCSEDRGGISASSASRYWIVALHSLPSVRPASALCMCICSSIIDRWSSQYLIVDLLRPAGSIGASGTYSFNRKRPNETQHSPTVAGTSFGEGAPRNFANAGQRFSLMVRRSPVCFVLCKHSSVERSKCDGLEFGARSRTDLRAL